MHLSPLVCERCGSTRFLLSDNEDATIKCVCEVCGLVVQIGVEELNRVQLGKWIDPPIHP